MVTLVPESPYRGVTMANDATLDDQTQAFKNVHAIDKGITDGLIRAIPALGTEAVDIASSSLGFTERDDISKAVTSDFPGLRDYILRNRGALEATTGIATVMLSAIPAARITKEAGPVTRALARIPGIGRITQLDQAALKTRQLLRVVDKQLAREGLSEAAALRATTTLKNPEILKALNVPHTINAAGEAVVKRNVVKNMSRMTSFAKGASQGIAAETGIYALGNENDMLYSDEAATNMFLAGIGVVVPGAFEAIQDAYKMRKFLSSDRYNQLADNAIDRGSFNKIADEALHKTGTQGQIATVNGSDVDQATMYALAANAKKVAPETERITNRLAYKRLQAANEDSARAFHFMNRATSEGIGVPNTGFSITKGSKTERHAQHVRALLEVDPTAFHGAEFVGKIPEGETISTLRSHFEDQTAALHDAAEALFKDGSPEAVEQAGRLTKLARHRESLVWMQARNMEVVPTHDTLGIRTEFSGNVKVAGSNLWEAEGLGIGVNDAGRPILPKGKTPQNLDLHDAQALFATGDRMLNAIKQRAKPVMQLSKKPSWFELDAAEEFLRRTENRGVVRWPGNLTRETAQVESLAQKVDIIKRSGKKTGTDFMLREKLNLPRLSSYERGTMGLDDTALDRFIEGVANGNDVRNYSLSDIKAGIADFKQGIDLAKYTSGDVDLLGNSFRLGKDFEGHSIAPLLVLKRPPESSLFTRGYLETRLANRQADIIGSLTSEVNRGTYVQQRTAQLLASPDYLEAIKTSRINDFQIQGLGSVGNKLALQYADSAFRDNPVLLAAQRLQSTGQKEIDAFFDSVLHMPVANTGKNASQIFSALRTQANSPSSHLVNQFITARRGWDLERDAVPLEGGMSGFKLQATEKNKRRWVQFFDSNMPKGALMRHQDGRVVSVDNTAMDALKAFSHIGDSIWKENNALMRAKGLGDIKHADWYVPSRDMTTKNKNVKFIIDGNGNAVQSLVTNSREEMTRLIAYLEKDPNSFLTDKARKQGYRIIGNEDVKRFATLWDRAYTGLNDPSIPIVQLGAKNKGAAQSPIVEFNAWEEGLKSFRSQYHRLNNDIVENVMRNQLDASRSRASALRSGEPISKAKPRNIHDYYQDLLLGRNPINNQGSRVGSIYKPIEQFGDDVLASAWERFTQSPLNPFKSGKRQAIRDYHALVKKFGDQVPFRDVNDYLFQKFAVQTPPTVRSVTGAVNQFTAGLMLRWMESAQAILNITGMINTSPSVIRYFTRSEGETAQQFAARVGHSATIIGDSSPVAIFDMPKIMQRAYSRAWKGEKAFTKEQWDFMRKRGYLDQEVAEFQRQLAAIGQSDEKWRLVMFGDANAPKGSVRSLGVEGLTSWMSDRSERFSRMYAHFVGLDIAQGIHGIKDFEAANVFAHDVANKVIANYNPLNRPEVFQGGIGAPLGLFQSYMFNYYQRLYRYIETGDMKSLAIQMSMQAGMFGAATVPGWQQYNDMYMWSEDGKTSATDGLYNRFGSAVGDLVTAGVLSNLPKLFGADGVALYTRGDASPRLPGVEGFPAQQVAGDFFKGFARGIDMFKSEHPGISGTEVFEVLNQMIPNRPISSFIDIGLGYSVDSRGNMISNDVRDGLNIAYRMMGMKPMRESKLREAYYSNQRENELQLAKRSKLLASARSLVRSGNPDAIPQIVEKYLTSGGNPAYLKNWMRDVILSAETPKAERELLDVLGNPNKMDQVNRLLNARAIE